MFSKIKLWLKKSGTYNYDGDEIIDELPFEKFFEHPNYPWFWLYRESFFDKLDDVYDLFLGTHYWSHELPSQKGLLDLLIFPSISRRLIIYETWLKNWAYDKHDILKFFVNFLLFLCMFIVLPLEAVRVILGGISTLLLSPLIFMVHRITYSKTQNYFKEIHQLQLTPHPESSIQVGSELGSLKEFTIKYMPETGFVLYDKKIDEPVYIIKMTSDNAEGIDALLATNTFKVLDKIKPEELIEIQTWLKNLSVTKKLVEEELTSCFDDNTLNVILTYANLVNRKQAGKVKSAFDPGPESFLPFINEVAEDSLEEKNQGLRP